MNITHTEFLDYQKPPQYDSVKLPLRESNQNTISKQSTTYTTPAFSSETTPTRKSSILTERILKKDIFNDISVSAVLNADNT
jgi:hypothetical protein